VEPSGAVGYALVRECQPFVPGTRVGIILTGGNLDLDQMPWAARAV
jgi:threonine dehydratase